ncbi:actin-related protein [Moniliophthora roreri MCA 2997]|uniref:Actin-related protein n=2 Tax=Moniliophthora roreri TaxID=221103 RepID=V2Z174_MONRO|nr:actin-related protein [Moniliophthora roreri MCA 2997]KAI3600487.1 actin-related protein [Moniliophthora roreri]
MSFHDATVVIIETSRTAVRANLGLHELLKTPSVEIQARVGLRKNTSNGDVVQTNDPQTITSATSSRISSLPHITSSTATVNDYLVGVQLDEALATGQDIAISWPFADGSVRDWTQAEAIWKYVLFNQLQRRRVQNESPVLLSIAAGLPRDDYERICQIFFERFNVAGFGILERPMAQIYATTSLSGVVVDIDLEKTDVTPVYEGFIVRNACTTVSLGVRDCQNYLVHLLRSSQSVMSSLSPSDSPLEPDALTDALHAFVKQLWEEGHIKAPSDGELPPVEDEGVTDIAAIVVAGKEKAVIESGMKKKATQKQSAAEQARAREIEAMDLITVQFKDKSITLGKERHRFCEPLFEPGVLRALPEHQTSSPDPPLSLQEAVRTAVGHAEIDLRQYIWQGIFVTGSITRYVKGISVALQSRLGLYMNNPELQTDIQPRSIRTLSLPEYYPEYRDTSEGYAAFLGSSITAKLIFGDNHGKNYVSKSDYSQKGPRSVVEMSPSLL